MFQALQNIKSVLLPPIAIVTTSLQARLPFSRVSGEYRPFDASSVVDHDTLRGRSVTLTNSLPPDQNLRSRAKHEFSLIALTLISWIAPALLILVAMVLIAVMYGWRYNNGLLVGAAAAGAIYALLQQNATTPDPVLVATLVDYALFQGIYYRLVTTILRLEKIFFVLTTFMAAAMVALMSTSDKLSIVWHNTTGLPGASSFLPVHLVIFFLNAMLVEWWDKKTKKHMLPYSTQDSELATSTSLADDGLGSRRRADASLSSAYLNRNR